jgi:hypothetical protein
MGDKPTKEGRLAIGDSPVIAAGSITGTLSILRRYCLKIVKRRHTNRSGPGAEKRGGRPIDRRAGARLAYELNSPQLVPNCGNLAIPASAENGLVRFPLLGRRSRRHARSELVEAIFN